tara:strand:- start:926 stop:1396 length:471 start_codon:yes stop_codon:yes gene_type:complete
MDDTSNRLITSQEWLAIGLVTGLGYFIGTRSFMKNKFEAEKKNCGCGKDPCITYGAEPCGNYGAESFEAKEEIYVFRDNLNTGYVGKPSQFKTKYGSSDVKELKQIIKQKDDLERVPSLIKFELKPKTIKRVISRKTPMPVDFNWTHQWNAESFED